ncbi:MAG TPA: rod shape-determining protein MreC [Actinomycetota bacterium]|nr:rod shape-determining protein MreC [Actinomycetota bacterium]
MFRRTGRGRLLLLVFLALSILVITLDFRQGGDGALGRAKDISTAIVAPIQRGFTAVFRPVGDFFSSIGELGDLRSTNNELEAELGQLRSEIEQAEALIGENQRLRDLMDLRESYASMETVQAEMIGRAPGNYQWAIFIDKGRADGILPDMAVVNPDGLVGKVIGAGEHTATIRLLIDPRAAAAARVEGGRDTGEVDGNGASENLSLELIGPNAEVSEGDRVITAGYDEGIFPAGIPIGVVTEVSEDPRALEREIEVDPFVDFTALDFVLVLTDTGKQISLQEKK